MSGFAFAAMQFIAFIDSWLEKHGYEVPVDKAYFGTFIAAKNFRSGMEELIPREIILKEMYNEVR